ncbi:response regulator [Spirosoma arcticum]
MNELRKVIYMADDDDDDRYFMRQALQTADPSVTILEAENGGDLLAMLRNWSQEPSPQPIPLILLDMNMPKMNGLETLMAIKTNPALRHIPAVIISTSADPGNVALAYQNGLNSYIQKPASLFDMTQIAQAIQVCFLNTSTG